MAIDYEKDIEIDAELLDSEWLDQPSKMLKYTKHCARMEKERDEAKEALELVKAELDKEIRTNPDKFKVEKITDKVVEATVQMQPAYKEANAEYLEAKFEYNVARGAVDAFDQRKTALENLVRLHNAGYFAGPSVPHDLSAMRAERKLKSEAGIAQKLKGGRTQK